MRRPGGRTIVTLMTKILAAFVILCCSCVGCSAEASGTPEQTTPPANQTEEPDATPTATASVHHAMCGCSIEGVGLCGNYIQIEDEYVHLEHPGLGEMEFCAQKSAGAKVEAVGAMADGEFVADSWQLAK